MSHATRAIAVVLFCLFFAIAAVASGWTGDFLDGGASGNATYEAMAITPSAVFDPETTTTVMAYQGSLLDPYICVYDHTSETWSDPVRVGSNASLARALDTHGGPALTQDAAGYFHVFWGAHNSRLLHARSAAPHDASAWVTAAININGASVLSTYPQPEVDSEGVLRVWIRRGETTRSAPLTPLRGDIASILTTNGVTWTRGATVVESAATALWYGGVHLGESGRRHMALIRAPRNSARSNADPFVRRDVYYLYSDDGEEWRESSGTVLPLPVTLETLESSGKVIDSGTDMVNQVVVRELADGSPCMLYLQGDTSLGDPVYEWRYIRLGPDGWSDPVVLAETDNFFDAADLSVDDEGNLSAYLIIGGEPDSQARIDGTGPAYASRGGDLALFASTDEGGTWSAEPTWIKQADGPNVRFNDPQVVKGATSDAQLLFSEWNTDASAYFHKVFLWGSEGLIGREFTPAITRFAGLNRVDTAARAAKAAYPTVASTVVLARKDDYPDVLCGVPLAHAYRAPILLVSPGRLDEETRAELVRLRPTRVVILGGQASVSSTVTAEVTAALSGVVDPKKLVLDRIPGRDRYETSQLIAARLKTLRGYPHEAIVVSGTGFADALAVSPYAARVGAPVILTRPGGLSPYTVAALASTDTENVYVAGGYEAVSESTEDALVRLGYSVVRAAGRDRYETARLVVERGLEEGAFGMQRFVVASGEAFPDATTGSYLAARVAGPLLLTRSEYLSTDAATIIDEEAVRVLDAYVMGGANALSDRVVDELQLRLIDDVY